MKIFSLQSNKISQNQFAQKQIARKFSTNPMAETPTETQLPSNDSKGMSLVFKATTPRQVPHTIGSNMKGLLAKIEAVKSAIKILENKSTSKSEEIVKAEKLVKDYEWWNSVQSDKYSEAKRKAQAAQRAEEDKHWGITNFFCSYGEDAYNKVMNKEYYDAYSYYRNITSWENDRAKQKVDAYNVATKASEEKRLAELALQRQLLKSYEDNINQMSIRDDVNAAMGHTGGLRERIAGYEPLKEEIERTFITPLIESVKKGNNDVHVPPAIMLYGATGCGKTSFLNAIRAQVGDYARVINLTDIDDPNFIGRLDSLLQEAKDYYIDTYKNSSNNQGKRTILLLNEAEVFLATNPEDMGASGMFFDKSDIRKMEEYNKIYRCSANVNVLKNKLDYISKLPTEECPEGCATTIFITSNYPHLIHRDLLSRDGINGKLLTYPVRPAANDDLRAVMTYYFTKFSDLIEQVKYYAKQPDCDSLIDSMTFVSNKGKEVLKKKAHDGTIENMSIDPTLSGFKNFNMYIKGNNPSLRRGAYSNARIESIAKDAFVKYLENPTVSYEQHFLEKKAEKGVDIMPAAYRQFERICDMVENPEKFKKAQTKEFGTELHELIAKYENGEIDEKEISVLTMGIKDIKARYKELKSKSPLTQMETQMKEKYEEFLDSISDIELPD